MKTFTYLKSAVLLSLMFIVGTAAAQTTILLEEDFANFSAGTPDAGAHGTNIASSLDDYTKVAGWTGDRVYQAGGTAKMGGSSALGFITTPAVDLSDASATYTLQFKAMAWVHTSEATTLKVYVDETLAYTAEGLNNTDYTLGSYTTTITGTASSKIRFEGAQASRGRFFLDDVVLTKSTGGVLPPVVMLPGSVNFPTLAPGENGSEDIALSATNLTGDLTVVVAGEGFTLTSAATITKAAAEAGAIITVNFAPTAVKDYTGTVTVSGGGLTENKVANLTGKGLTLVGEGTKTNPFTIADVIAMGNTNKGPHWVKGYIVGTILYQADPEFAPPFTTNTALYMGDVATERDVEKLMPVQLPAGEIRTALNLMDNPGNLGMELLIYGNLEAYFSVPGLRSPSEYELTGVSVGNQEITNRIFTEGGNITVITDKSGLIEVYNIVGQQILTQQANVGNNPVNGLVAGQVYIVKFNGKTQKVVL